MNSLGKVNSFLFGLKVVRCIQNNVSGFKTFLGSSLLGLSTVVDMGTKTGFCQKLLAHSASQVTVAAGKVDSIAQGVTKCFVNNMLAWRTTETGAVRGIVTSNPGEEMVFDKCHDIKYGMDGSVEQNKNEDVMKQSKKTNLRSPLSNLCPMLSAAKKTAVNCKSVTSQMVSNISQAIPLAVGGTSKERTALVEDEVLESNIEDEVKFEEQRKNVLIEYLTFSLLLMMAIIYVTIYSCITQLLLNTFVMVRVVMEAMLDWIYQRRLGLFVTILGAVNIMLLVDCSL